MQSNCHPADRSAQPFMLRRVMLCFLHALDEKMTDDAACFELRTTTKTFEILSLETFWLNHVSREKIPELQIADIATNSRVVTYCIATQNIVIVS